MKGTAVFFHFLSRLFINVGITGFNKMLGNVIHIVEVVGCEVVIAFFVIFPIESKPIDGTKNGINVFLIFFTGLVSSKRIWHRPSNSFASPKFKQILLACPICR